MSGSTNKKNETPKDRFKRLATLRTNEILKKLRILSNCANRSFYDYTDEDVKKIFLAIEEELKVARARFKRNRKKEFKL